MALPLMEDYKKIRNLKINSEKTKSLIVSLFRFGQKLRIELYYECKYVNVTSNNKEQTLQNQSMNRESAINSIS